MIKSIRNSEHYTWGNNCDGWRLLQSDNMSIIEERMPAHTREVLHYHRFAQQVFYILSGTATFEINSVIHHVQAHESIHIPPLTWHRIYNNNANDLKFLVISQPKASGDRIELIEYSGEYKAYVKTLNYEWLEKYFSIEKVDEAMLADPQGQIIDKGGYIFLARKENEIIGTFSLLKKSEDVFELSKMAITENIQGFGIGNMLLEHCIAFSKLKNFKKLILYSNTKLLPAIHLYRKFGFSEVVLEKGLYERSNIKMEKTL